MTQPAAPVRRLTGRHVLIGVTGFFVVIVGLDSLFAVWAVQTFPGEVSPHAYEDGLAYNHSIAGRRAQSRLGWRMQVTQLAAPGAVTARVLDARGEPLRGLAVQARFTRPATADGARTVRLGSAAPGVYAGAAALAEGAWDLTVTARDPGGHSFEARRRLVWR